MRRKYSENESLKSEAPAEAQVNSTGPESYRVINMTESMMPLPYYDETGNVKTLHLRIQGRGGQVPPIVSSAAITDKMRDLVKKRMIRLEKIK